MTSTSRQPTSTIDGDSVHVDLDDRTSATVELCELDSNVLVETGGNPDGIGPSARRHDQRVPRARHTFSSWTDDGSSPKRRDLETFDGATRMRRRLADVACRSHDRRDRACSRPAAAALTDDRHDATQRSPRLSRCRLGILVGTIIRLLGLLLRTPPPCVSTPSPASADACGPVQLAAPTCAVGLRASSRFATTPSRTRSTATTSALGRFERLLRITCSDPNDPQNGRLRWQVASPPDPAILLPGATRTATEQIDVPRPCDQPDRRRGDQPRHVARRRAGRPVRRAGRVQRRGLGRDHGDARHDHVRLRRRHATGRVRRSSARRSHPTSSTAPSPDRAVTSTPTTPTIGPHTLTITVTWRVTWRLSNGRTGQLADIVTTRAARLRGLRGADGRRQRLTRAANSGALRPRTTVRVDTRSITRRFAR